MLLLGVGHLRSRESLIIWVAMSKMPLCGRCCCTVDLTFVLVPWSQGRGMNTSRNDTLCFLTIFWLVVPSSTLLMWESSAQTFQCHTWLSRDQTPLIKKINWSDYLSIAQIVAWQTRMIKATPNYLSLLAWSEMMKNPISTKPANRTKKVVTTSNEPQQENTLHYRCSNPAAPKTTALFNFRLLLTSNYIKN